MSPDIRILEQNLERLLLRAYVPVLPKPAFRDELGTTFAMEVLRLGRTRLDPSTTRSGPNRSRLPLAIAAGLLGLLFTGWSLASFFGDSEKLAPPRSFLAQGDVAIYTDHGPWRRAEEKESRDGIEFLTAHLRLLTPEQDRDTKGTRILADEWTIEVFANSELSLQQTREGLRVRLVNGSAQVVSTDGSALELEPASTRFLPRASLAGAETDALSEQPAVAVREPSARTSTEDMDKDPQADGLQGRVIDAETKAPITKFRVALLEPTNHQQFYAPSVQDFDSADGVFHITEIPAEERFVFVHAEGYAMWALGANDLRTLSTLDVRLERGTTIRGRVIDGQTQLPIANALVFSEKDAPTENLPFQGADKELWLPVKTRTLSDGTFKLEHSSMGTHRIRANKPGYAVGWGDDVILRERGTVDLGNLQLERGGSISGHVTQEDGSAWVGARVICMTMKADQRTMHFGMASTDEQGKYEIRNLPPIVLLAVLSRGNDTPWVRPLNVSSGQETIIDFLLGREGTRVTGMLFDAAGRPVPEQSLGVFDAADLEEGFNDHWVATATNNQGQFTLERVVPGEYVVYLVDDSGMGLRLVDRFTVAGEPESLHHEIRLEKGSIQGVVRGAALGNPVAGAMVQLLYHGDERTEFGGYQTTRADGSYRFDGLRAGVYTATAVPSTEPSTLLGHERVEGIIVDEFQPKYVQDFELGEGCEVLLRVIDTDGNPLPYADAHLIDSDGNEVSFSPIPVTDESGFYRVRGARPGSYRASARLIGHRTEKAPSIECEHGKPVRVDVVLAPLSPDPSRQDRQQAPEDSQDR